MKIGLAQINTTVGDLAGNRQLVLSAYERLVAQGAELVLFPELALCGYPPRDLLFKTRFVPDVEASLQEVAKASGSVPLVVGTVRPNPSRMGRPFINAAAWCENGEVREVAEKMLLPTYDVFDEDRYFQPGTEPIVVEHQGKRFGLTICEDIWTAAFVETRSRYRVEPLGMLDGEELDVLLNLSASPWHFGKGANREAIVRAAAERVGCPCAYCNAVGGNDELVFDGHSMVASPDGKIIAGLASFRADEGIIDLEADTTHCAPTFRQEALQDIRDALALGLRDYTHKSGFKSALIGLSGGIDSALTAAIAAEALGAENVIGVSLPSEISSEHSRTDAEALARNLGIRFHQVPIAEVVGSAEATLGPIFKGLEADVTEENIQARSRGLLLMAMSNKLGALLLTTGNKSELAVGYCTLYGDMCGGLAVISDLPKTKVFALCRWLNRDREVIPWNTITKPPSAELRPDQKDEDSLPPYDILDDILRRYVEEGQSSGDIIEAGFEEAVVRDMVRKVDLNEYKRKQAAPGLKISPLAFGVGRRIPIVQRYVG